MLASVEIVERTGRVFRAAFPADDDEAERKALVIVSLCVGGMVIARTTERFFIYASGSRQPQPGQRDAR